MPESKGSKSSKGSGHHNELYDCKIIIHGRFHLKANETFESSEAHAYVHMNKRERDTKQAVSEKASFKFYDKHLKVVKPNLFSSVKESKYEYDNIEKYFVFSDYPGIVVFCIQMQHYRLAFLFECQSEEIARKTCNIVEKQRTKPSKHDDSSISDTSSDEIPGNTEPVVMRGGSFEEGSPARSRPKSDGSGKHKSDSSGSHYLKLPAGSGYGRRSPNAPRPQSGGPEILYGGSLERSHTPDRWRPRSYIESDAPPLINVAFDRSRSVNGGPSSPRISRHKHSSHKKGQRSGAYVVTVLGRYLVKYPREDFNTESAHGYLRGCLANPSTAFDKGELHLYPDCMKLTAIDSGHYDFSKIYRVFSFKDDPLVLIFGLEEKHKLMYMLLRFQSVGNLREAHKFIMGKADETLTTDYTLSDMRGTRYGVNGGGNIDQLSKTIALPSEREIQDKQNKRHSHSSSSSDSHSRGEEDVIVSTRREGVQRAPPTESSSRNYDTEFAVLWAHVENDQTDDTRYIDSVVVDELDATHTTTSTMYVNDDEDTIEASFSSRAHASFTPMSMVGSESDGTQWIEEAAYIDYHPGKGVVESDSGPVYMYCARQIRKNSFKLRRN